MDERGIHGLSGYVGDDLLKYLDNIENPGDFATIKQLKVVPDLKIKLRNANDSEIQDIAIPLGPRDALKLIDVARQAPFGKGEETIVDTSIRNTWELNPDQFSLSGEWQQYVDKIKNAACEDLGVQTEVRAELYKMLLYEKGAMFKPHADSEKVPGMFGTLVISLPSAHFGGAVVVTHNGQRRVLQTQYHDYLAWYSDVVHEVEEVTSGYRWVLTYNLVRQSTQSAAEAASAKLHAILANWKLRASEEDSDEIVKAVYLLKHQYTSANMKIGCWKALQACGEHGCSLYLASLEREVIGEADEDGVGHYYDNDDDSQIDGYSDTSYHSIEGVIKDKIMLNCVADTDGNEILDHVPIEEEDILQINPFERRPNKSHFTGFTGNEGCTSTHWYKDTAVVIVPNENIADLFLAPGKAFTTKIPDEKVLKILRYLEKRHESAPEVGKEAFLTSIGRLCKKIVMENKGKTSSSMYGRTRKYDDRTLSELAKTCLSLDRIYEFTNLAPTFGDLPESVVHSLKGLIPQIGFDRVQPIFRNIVLGKKGISARCNAVAKLIGIDPTELRNHPEVSQELRSWVSTIIQEICSECDSFTDNDAIALARLDGLDPSGSLLKDHFVPVLKQQLENTTPEKTNFVMTLLSQLFTRQSSDLPRADLSSTYTSILKPTIPGLTLRTLSQSRDTWSDTFTFFSDNPYYREPIPAQPALNGHTLATILYQCRVLDLVDCIEQMADKIASGIPTMNPSDFSVTILSLLKGLVTTFKEKQIQPDVFATIFRRCLTEYIIRYVGEQPVALGWSRQTVSCGCGPCKKVSAFLESPVQREMQFSYAQSTENHMRGKLCSQHSLRFGRGAPAPFHKKQANTFTITKTTEKFDKEVAEREQRIKEVKGQIKDLEGHDSVLKSLLGGRYEHIKSVDVASLRVVARQDSSRTSGQAVSTEGAQPPQVAGQKRKAVVLDLTDD